MKLTAAVDSTTGLAVGMLETDASGFDAFFEALE
jgi:hypothetical protein